MREKKGAGKQKISGNKGATGREHTRDELDPTKKRASDSTKKAKRGREEV